MEQVIETQVTLDYCKECDAVVRSNECEHEDREWLNFVEW